MPKDRNNQVLNHWWSASIKTLTGLSAVYCVVIFFYSFQQDQYILKYVPYKSTDAVSYILRENTTMHKLANTASLEDLFIAVRTTARFHERIAITLKTWYNLARDQVHIFTDGNFTSAIKDGVFVRKGCTPGHIREHLCCKIQMELDTYMETRKRWFCHFDDDVYVNIPRLLVYLSDYSQMEHCYLGAVSMRYNRQFHGTNFTFATGAAYCICRSTMIKLVEGMGNKTLWELCDHVYSDDVCLAYYIAFYTGVNLTITRDMTNQLRTDLPTFTEANIHKLITIGVSKQTAVSVAGYSQEEDPTRFLSVHCVLSPHPGCPSIHGKNDTSSNTLGQQANNGSTNLHLVKSDVT